MYDGQLVMAMRLLQEPKVTLKTILALKALDLVLHGGDVGG
jgi:hypothetical protein